MTHAKLTETQVAGLLHVTRVFNRPEFSGRHDFQAKKFGRQCTKFGSHAAGLYKKNQAKT